MRHIEAVVGEVCRACEALALPPRAARLAIPVALAEALANAIQYGNACDVAKSVHVRVWVDAASFVLEVRDEGAGFDFDACVGDPTCDAELEREDGRGLFLMRALMDRVDCFREGGGVVRMTLHRA